ncbi:hypothetical protein ACRRTK_004713 [Alexandromys fortis]
MEDMVNPQRETCLLGILSILVTALCWTTRSDVINSLAYEQLALSFRGGATSKPRPIFLLFSDMVSAFTPFDSEGLGTLQGDRMSLSQSSSMRPQDTGLCHGLEVNTPDIRYRYCVHNKGPIVLSGQLGEEISAPSYGNNNHGKDYLYDFTVSGLALLCGLSDGKRFLLGDGDLDFDRLLLGCEIDLDLDLNLEQDLEPFIEPDLDLLSEADLDL